MFIKKIKNRKGMIKIKFRAPFILFPLMRTFDADPPFLPQKRHISRALMGNRFILFGHWIAALINVLNDVIFLLSQIGHLKSRAVLRLSRNSLRHKHAQKERLKQGVPRRRTPPSWGSVVIARWEMVGSHRSSAAAARLQPGCGVMTHMPMLFHLQAPGARKHTPGESRGDPHGWPGKRIPHWFLRELIRRQPFPVIQIFKNAKDSECLKSLQYIFNFVLKVSGGHGKI